MRMRGIDTSISQPAASSNAMESEVSCGMPDALPGGSGVMPSALTRPEKPKPRP